MKKMNVRWTMWAVTAVALGSMLMLGACKTSVEAQQKRYTSAKDRIEAFATKNPMMKADIHKKLAEFDKQYKDATAKTGDEAIKLLVAVCTRMESYEKQINPAAAKKADPKKADPKKAVAPAKPTGAKLGAKPVAPAAPTGTKLGATPVAPKPVAPAPKPVAPAPKPAPAGGSGFGGK